MESKKICSEYKDEVPCNNDENAPGHLVKNVLFAEK